MIFPRGPLLWLAGLWVVPLNLAAALYPAHAGACVAAMLPAFAAAAWDALRLRGRLDGLRPAFDPSARFTLAKPGTLALTLQGALAEPLRVRMAVELPSLLAPPLAVLDMDLSPGAGNWAFSLAVTPVRRGRAPAGRFAMETVSRLGLWTLRKEGTADSDVRVYPGLGGKSGRSALPETTPQAGMHRRRQAGKGREFDKLREYLHGDDFHDIHWKATAKRGYPVTKTFQVENTQQVYVVVDASRLGAVPLFATAASPAAPSDPAAGHAPLPLEYFLRTALRLGMAADAQGDRYGLMLFADRPLAFLRAGKGKPHYGRFRDMLASLESAESSPDYAEVFTALRLRLRKRAMIIFLCSLDEPALAEGFAEGVGLLSRQHLVSVVSLRSPSLRPIFQGALPDSDAEAAARLADQVRLRQLDRVAADLRGRGAIFRAWEPARLSAEAVAEYLDAKRRRVVS